MWMPTTSPITSEDRFVLPSEPTSSTVFMYLHSKCTGERATRGGLTCRDGSISSPSFSGSLSAGSNSADEAFITSRNSHVAMLYTNSPVSSALVCESFLGPDEKTTTGG